VSGGAEFGTGPAWLLLGLGLLVVVVQRRTLAVGAVSAQALVLAALALSEARGADEVAAAAALALRGLLLGLVFVVIVARTRDPQPVRSGTPPVVRGALAVGLALALVWLVPGMGLASRAAEAVVLGLVAFGLAVGATRRATVFQILGVLMVENGMSLAALSLPGTSWLIELAAAVDVTLVALVAGVFHQRIFAEFGAGDTAALRSLRD
jgi:hydrogenase-4 membrane subunit HyfE